MPRELRLRCEAADAPVRLDLFLSRKLPEYSREYLKQLIDAGHARIGSKRPKPSAKLTGGEEIELSVPDPVPVALGAETIPLDICFEDSHLLVVNKPRGMLTHPTSDRSPQGTLVNALLGHCKDLGGINGELRPGIVHRLDRETSGLLVIAKIDTVQRALSAQFKDRSVDKRYFALAEGQVRPARGMLQWPIGRHPVHRTKMRVDEERGRSARTEYRVVAVYTHASLLLIRLHSGRTHQIRVHLAKLGHPLVGDVSYGARAGCFQGVALHSARLSFLHPATGQRLGCSRPIPADFRELVRRAARGEKL
ncbi:MAG: RluA family pseudouridine synthase [Candidatus Wallbacteria bacterium]|nr:RluA family pseudouridine synthase [Candidatus Wallbacteria bacterium]